MNRLLLEARDLSHAPRGLQAPACLSRAPVVMVSRG